jgi:DNA phosphorothioation-dependent restriction protein DptF
MGFKQLLDSLKLSSKEAIVDGEKDSLNTVKKYLHINRDVEIDLYEMIDVVGKSDKPSLILLLGNVGDGKSHLLARMWEQLPHLMEKFKVHNDATESVFKNKTYLENLAEVFQPYSDESLKSSSSPVKTIIAINLGTLTNFLEEAGNEFTMLRHFIFNNHLLDQDNPDTNKELNEIFSALNLTDYHIFTLSEDSAKSKVFIDIIDRITKRTNENPFFKEYKDTYSNHPNSSLCPVKYNFDLLSKPTVQEALSTLLVKVILADKLIIPVRLLMNLIFDLVVPPEFSPLTDDEIQSVTVSAEYKKRFYRHTLTVLLFESAATSNILKSFSKYDPVSSTDENLDEMIIKLSTIAAPALYFKNSNLLDSTDPLLDQIADLTINQTISLFLRLHFFNKSLTNQDEVFKSFLKNLYDFNSGKKRELLNLYKQVSYAVYQWNGTTRSEADYINLDIGRKQSTFKISQKLQLQYAPMTVHIPNNAVLNKFLKTINITFQVQGHNKNFSLEIDYPLYQLIGKINKGYRPNRIDKSIHVKFTQFVSELVKYESETKELIIQEFNGENRRQFKLAFIPGFDDFQFTEA